MASAIAHRVLVFNDTPAKHDDILKMTVNQLTDERTRLITVTEVFDAKGDKLSSEDASAYSDAVDRIEAVQNALSKTPAGLAERKNALLATSRIANATSGLTFDFSKGIHTRPAWEDDKEKFGFKNQQEYLGAVINAYKGRNPEAIDPRL